MKKILALMLTLLMVLSLAACSEAPSTTPTAGNTDTSSEDTIVPTEVVSGELHVFENETCSILVTGITPEDLKGYVIDVSLANHTERKESIVVVVDEEVDEEGNVAYFEDEHVENTGTDLVFELVSVAANGTEIPVTFSAQLEANTQNDDQIILPDEVLKDIEDDITEIKLTFRVYDALNPSVDLVNVSSTLYPLGNAAATEADA